MGVFIHFTTLKVFLFIREDGINGIFLPYTYMIDYV